MFISLNQSILIFVNRHITQNASDPFEETLTKSCKVYSTLSLGSVQYIAGERGSVYSRQMELIGPKKSNLEISL